MSTPFKMRGFSGFGNSPMREEETSAHAKSLQGHMNKHKRLSGGVVSYEDAWKSMHSDKRAKFNDNFDTFVKEAESFKESNPDYKHGTKKYKNYQGKY